jgi:hypothetical protein
MASFALITYANAGRRVGLPEDQEKQCGQDNKNNKGPSVSWKIIVVFEEEQFEFFHEFRGYAKVGLIHLCKRELEGNQE